MMNKISRKKIWLYLLFIIFTFSECKNDDPFTDNSEQNEEKRPIGKEPATPVLRFLSFSFNKSLNPQLAEDVRGTIVDDKITLLLPETASGIDLNLIPSFIGEYKNVEVAGKVQTSGVTAQNFIQTVNYILTSEKGTTKTYEVTVKVFTGIPIVWIETENREAITSKEDYVKGTVTISKTPPFTEGFEATMRIRGRGNATWSYAKKPYRIKLDSKSKILGMPADKDWVLLAEYCDKSLLRTTYAFELSKLMELPWTPHGYHVEVFLNGSYNGTY